ncbi:MAG TPA: citrate synthase family protein [Stellaceae bacterium]|nr:citrate synthase family protein [Stellaceae bacterium]
MLLSASEAAELLGIKLDTLYAYVSRGLLNSVGIADSRQRHYDADDIERFRATRGARGKRVPEALMPVIPSSICLIENHRLYYRGYDAVALAETASLEDVAAILWDVEGSSAALGLPAASARPSSRAREEGRGEGRMQLGVIERCQIRLADFAAADLAALDLSRAGVARTAYRILGALVSCVGGEVPLPEQLHARLAAAWRLDAVGSDLIRRCLVLLADHELNASTFVARCIASTAATPYAVVSGALAALSGRRHGGQSAQVEAMFREMGEVDDPMSAMAARLSRGEMLPGLGQSLYPQGDPRARAIIDALARARPQPGGRVIAAAAAATRLTGEAPNVDFALGAVSVALGLPPGAALGMFLVARSVGWIAHAMEQYETGVLIRPRARYSGRRPDGKADAGEAVS